MSATGDDEGRAPERAGGANGGADALSFEDATKRLGKIVEQLEAGDLPLEKSLELFEEGVRLARSAQERLASAEKRVEELLGIGEGGKPIVREFSG